MSKNNDSFICNVGIDEYSTNGCYEYEEGLILWETAWSVNLSLRV